MSTQIDESLYSRQLYAIGKDTMTSIVNAKVLIINLDPLAIEICKNIILCGVGSITLADTNTISEKDYNNYYISAKDFGKNRAEIIGSRLQELNGNVKITKYSGIINSVK
jgi:ubiquitin-activating enzyme E1